METSGGTMTCAPFATAWRTVQILSRILSSFWVSYCVLTRYDPKSGSASPIALVTTFVFAPARAVWSSLASAEIPNSVSRNRTPKGGNLLGRDGLDSLALVVCYSKDLSNSRGFVERRINAQNIDPKQVSVPAMNRSYEL